MSLINGRVYFDGGLLCTGWDLLCGVVDSREYLPNSGQERLRVSATPFFPPSILFVALGSLDLLLPTVGYFSVFCFSYYYFWETNSYDWTANLTSITYIAICKLSPSHSSPSRKTNFYFDYFLKEKRKKSCRFLQNVHFISPLIIYVYFHLVIYIHYYF